LLAAACAARGIGLVTFSSDQVFDGRSDRPWNESDAPAPLNVYGQSKAEAERAVLAAHPGALVVRTSAFFGPWDRHNFVGQALDALAAGGDFFAADDQRISPTYVPDLVHAVLCLLVDGESGVLHLANVGDVSWHELAARAADLAGVDASRLRGCSGATLGQTAPRPRHAVLGSERVSLMRPLDAALCAFLDERVVATPAALPEAAVSNATANGRRR
jgi:dTDP-4-dehydrorhamnose reductase